MLADATFFVVAVGPVGESPGCSKHTVACVTALHSHAGSLSTCVIDPCCKGAVGSVDRVGHGPSGPTETIVVWES